MKKIIFTLAIVLLTTNVFAKTKINKDFDRKKYAEDFLNFSLGKETENDYPHIYRAILNVLNIIPEDALEKFSNPKFPVIFTINITTGIAHFANSGEIYLPKNTNRTFKEGFYLMKLADEMEHVEDPEAIEGIVLHELAHNYLNHLRAKEFSCNMEREANRLVKKWGFEEKYLKAKKAFGSKTLGDSPCRDK